ncbi:MAG: hypothetical protein AAF492_11735, partial [Verrucomicrobiota bacterium]
MMVARYTLIAFFLCLIHPAWAGESVRWSTAFPPVPDEHGFAGPFAGVIGTGEDRWLLVGGGANFPDGAPWEIDEAGNRPAKIWHDALYAIRLKADRLEAAGAWTKLSQTLPEKLGYGASVSLPARGSALFIGGNRVEDGDMVHVQSVYEITRENGAFQFMKVADLPVGLSSLGAAAIGQDVYVVSGEGEQGSVEGAWVLRTEASDNQRWAWEPVAWPESGPGVKA